MRFGILRIILSVIIILISLPLFSQDKADYKKTEAIEAAKIEATEKEEPPKLWVDLSGLMYFEWAYFTGFNNPNGNPWGKVAKWGIDDINFPTLSGAEPTNYSYKNNNTFTITRTYLTLRKDIGDLFSVKITADIQPGNPDFIFLKYGFVQFRKEFFTPYGPIDIKVQGGLIFPPNVEITDWLNDLRWIGANYLTQSNTVLNGKIFDYEADFGGLFSMGILRLLRLAYTYTNGEGYLVGANETYAGKAHTLLVSINPEAFRIKELFLNFYGRWENTNKNQIDTSGASYSNPLGLNPPTPPIKYYGIDKRNYLGAGLAWRSELIKIGLNFFMPQIQFTRTDFILPVTDYEPGHKVKYYLVDSWINFNFGAIMRTIPILAVGRCAWGREVKNEIENARNQRDTIVVGAGVGYQFNQHFRLAAYYEYIRYTLTGAEEIMEGNDFSRRNPTPNNNVHLKVEVKY